MICVLMVAAGAPWESGALGQLNARSGVHVLKRCVDVNDLLATATAGQADVAVVSSDAPGLDATAVDHLRRYQMRVVVLAPDASMELARTRANRIGVATVIAESRLEDLGNAVLDRDGGAVPEGSEPVLAPQESGEPGTDEPADGQPPAEPTDVTPTRPGKVIAVWGPQGAPGRTTVAVNLAAELAHRGEPTLLVDADPWGGGVAQHLGILDEVSGVLAAARLAAAGTLDEHFGTVPRVVSDQLSVVSGLPRPDRWVEVRAGAVEHLLDVGRRRGHVVVDTGFSLEEDPASDFGSRPGRNSMTLGALTEADEILVVGGADPVSLARLARGLVDVRESAAATPIRVVVNRMRSSLGWNENEISGMVDGFARLAGTHFLPEDRSATDKALVAGRSLREGGDSGLLRAVARLADVLVGEPEDAAGGGRSVRWRRAGRGRRR